MISLHKYIYGMSDRPDDVQPAAAEALLLLTAGLMESIAEQVLNGKEHSQLRSEFDTLRAQLGPALQGEAAAVMRASAEHVLRQYATAVRQDATNRTIEMQHILEVLNQTLTGVASGSERSMSRLHKIQGSLQRASVMHDMTSLKSCLAETMQFIRTEAHREQEVSTRQMADLETELGAAREVANRFRPTLPGRPEGVRYICEELKAVPPQLSVCVLAYRFERLHALTQRYGADASEELLFRMIRERVQPLAPSGVSFRWSPSSLVAVFQHDRTLPEVVARAAALNRTPLVYRLPLGNRTATLTVHPSHLVAEASPGSAKSLIAEADAFTGAAA
jgi:hypothetical protein